MDGLAHRTQDQLVIQRLREELDCACLHRLHSRGDIRVSTRENDRHFCSIRKQPLKLEAADLRKIQIENQAPRCELPRSTEKLVSGSKRFDYPSRVVNQRFQRLPDRTV